MHKKYLPRVTLAQQKLQTKETDWIRSRTEAALNLCQGKFLLKSAAVNGKMHNESKYYKQETECSALSGIILKPTTLGEHCGK